MSVSYTHLKAVDFYEYSPLDEDAFMENSLKNTVDQSNKHFMPNSKYQTGIYASKEYTGALDLNNPALFEKEQVQEELAGNFEARETVTWNFNEHDRIHAGAAIVCTVFIAVSYTHLVLQHVLLHCGMQTNRILPEHREYQSYHR